MFVQFSFFSQNIVRREKKVNSCEDCLYIESDTTKLSFATIVFYKNSLLKLGTRFLQKKLTAADNHLSLSDQCVDSGSGTELETLLEDGLASAGQQDDGHAVEQRETGHDRE